MKELCTQKRTTNVPKTAFLTANISSIISNLAPVKYKDPGCPTIGIRIGNTYIRHALLDLGASVNLLPYTIYCQLGLGEMKPTNITIQLADRSTRRPMGIVEDVLIQIEQFYFPVDFIILETESVPNPDRQIPVILGRPFLATSNAIINCRSGQLRLSFGHLTIELNIFNMNNQSRDYEEIDMVQTIENDKSSDTTEAWNACLNHFNFDFDEFEYITELNNMLDSHTSPLDLSFETSFEQGIENEPTLEFEPLEEENKPHKWLDDNELTNSSLSSKIVHKHTNLWDYNDKYLEHVNHYVDTVFVGRILLWDTLDFKSWHYHRPFIESIPYFNAKSKNSAKNKCGGERCRRSSQFIHHLHKSHFVYDPFSHVVVKLHFILQIILHLIHLWVLSFTFRKRLNSEDTVQF